jgi:ADP-heptose:LPS heptosyltransferase
MCTPAVRALRERFPKSYIGFLAESQCSDLLSLNPHLSEVIVLERNEYRNPFYWLKKIRQIRGRRFDLVIDYLGNPRSAYISFLSGARCRLGYDIPGRRLFYNTVIKDDPTALYSAAYKLGVLKHLGIESSDLRIDFSISDEARAFAEGFFREEGVDQDRMIVSISPTSRRHFRRWPYERFAQLADWLILRFGACVILVWGPNERKAVETIAQKMKEKPIICRQTKNLLQLGAILEKCDLHLGNDNGTKHIAVAMGKPTITIYGPEDPRSWTYPDPLRHKFLKAQVDCPDCDKIKHRCTELACLNKIAVEDVEEVFLQMLKDLRENQERGIARKIEHLAAD